MCLIRLNHLIAVLAIFETTALTQQNVKHPFMAASWGYKHLDILSGAVQILWQPFWVQFLSGFGGGTNFLLNGCCVGQCSFASCKCGYAHGYLMCTFCTFSFVFNFHVFFGTHVITQTQDIMTGVLVGNDVKETQTQKFKRWQRKRILTKRLLENQGDRKKRREPEVVALQNDTQKCYSIWNHNFL